MSDPIPAGAEALPVTDDGTGGQPEASEFRQLADEVRALRSELDRMLPHLVAAVKRDQAHQTLVARLEDAERRLETRRERPSALTVLGVLHRVRHLELEPAMKAALDADLVGVLKQAGFEEIGVVGEPFDPRRHEPLSSTSRQDAPAVTRVYASGLASFGDVVARAQVQVGAVEDALTRGD